MPCCDVSQGKNYSHDKFPFRGTRGHDDTSSNWVRATQREGGQRAEGGVVTFCNWKALLFYDYDRGGQEAPSFGRVQIGADGG